MFSNIISSVRHIKIHINFAMIIILIMAIYTNLTTEEFEEKEMYIKELKEKFKTTISQKIYENDQLLSKLLNNITIEVGKYIKKWEFHIKIEMPIEKRRFNDEVIDMIESIRSAFLQIIQVLDFSKEFKSDFTKFLDAELINDSKNENEALFNENNYVFVKNNMLLLFDSNFPFFCFFNDDILFSEKYPILYELCSVNWSMLPENFDMDSILNNIESKIDDSNTENDFKKKLHTLNTAFTILSRELEALYLQKLAELIKIFDYITFENRTYYLSTNLFKNENEYARMILNKKQQLVLEKEAYIRILEKQWDLKTKWLLFGVTVVPVFIFFFFLGMWMGRKKNY